MTIKDYLTNACLFLNISDSDLDVEEETNEDKMRVNLIIPKDKQEPFISNNAEGVLALEYLLKLVFRDQIEGKRFLFDINNYRQSQEEVLITKAKKTAHEVLSSNQEQVVEGLNSYERYLVHSAIAEDEELAEVITFSKDVGRDRWLVIAPKSSQVA